MTGWQIVSVIGMVFLTLWALIAVGVVAQRSRVEEKRIAADIHISDNEMKVATTPRSMFGQPLPAAEHTGEDAPKRVREPARG